MKAPDKIFMPNELLSEEWQRHIEGEDTAYIRKDALIEWLKLEKDIFFPEDYERGCIDGRNGLREELIDKLNSM